MSFRPLDQLAERLYTLPMSGITTVGKQRDLGTPAASGRFPGALDEVQGKQGRGFV
jgi:hypothetical protein